jgi:hypothetical protein
MAHKKTPAPPVEEMAVLFPEEQVGPYRFRPWSLEQFSLLVPVLLQVIPILENSGIPPEQLKDRAFEILPFFAPHFSQIIGVTLGVSPAEYEEISIGFRMALGLRILVNAENMAQIKNFLAGLIGGNPSPATAT